MKEFSEPLKSGAKLPTHPSETTARKIVRYGEVTDSRDGHPLTGGLHQNEIQMLRSGEVGGLAHTYRYCFVQEGNERKIYHTRSRVTICVETLPIEDANLS